MRVRDMRRLDRPEEPELSPLSGEGNGAPAGNEDATASEPAALPSRAVLESFPWLKAMKDPSELQALMEAMHEDGHRQVLNPSHVVLKSGAAVGSASLGSLPFVHVWFDSKKVRAREMLSLVNLMENQLKEAGGYNLIVVPCAEQSPLFPYMEAMGYELVGVTPIFIKRLRSA